MLERVETRTTTEELITWQEEAARLGVSLSALLRAKMNGEPVRVIAAADPELLAEFKHHNNNLNQLLHLIHGGYPLPPDPVLAAIGRLIHLYRREIERG